MPIRDNGREVCWHSMLLGVSVMKKMGLKPLLDTPLKGDYVIHDTARYVRRYSLELNRKVTDPMMDPRAAARGFYWIRRNRPGHEADFARAVFASLGRKLAHTHIPLMATQIPPPLATSKSPT